MLLFKYIEVGKYFKYKEYVLYKVDTKTAKDENGISYSFNWDDPVTTYKGIQ